MLNAMKLVSMTAFLLAARVAQGAHPIHKVMEMISGMQEKIVIQGEDFQKMYAKFSEWCSDRSRELHLEVKLAKAQIATLESTMEQASDRIVALDTKIGEISAQLSTDVADRKAIQLIRDKERKDFDKTQLEMRDMISALTRAITILERETKGGSSLAQLQSTGDMVKVFSAMVEANALNSADAKTLSSLVQSRSDTEQGGEEEEDDESLAAPDADAYQSKSSSIVETLESLLDKAQAELDVQRTAETEKNGNYQLLKQELDNRIKMANKEMEEAKKLKAEEGEKKATSEGDLSVTKTDLSSDVETLGDLHHKCIGKAEDFQSETKARGEELKALAKAKQIISSIVKQDEELVQTRQTSSQEGSQEDSQDNNQDDSQDSSSDVSFVQMHMKMTAKSRSKGGTPLGVKIVHLLKKRAKHLKSTVLAQFVQNLDAAIRSATLDSRNPLANVMQLITDMIATLEKEAGDEADHKAYCDKELSYAEEKKANKVDESEGLTAKLDRRKAESAKLAEQIGVLQKELSEIAKTQSEMDTIRKEEETNFKRDKTETEEAIKAIQTAMEVLRDFYAKADENAQAGASSVIIGMLEVCESDFSKELSNMIAEEEASQTGYKETTNENELAKAAKEQDVKFKTSRSKMLAKSSSELTQDRDGMQTEIDAANDYLARLKSMCIAKPEPYEERKKRREEELASLREAHDMLSSTSFLQEGAVTKRVMLRGGAGQEEVGA